MCGIVGLFLKDKALEPKLGDLLSDMLILSLIHILTLPTILLV